MPQNSIPISRNTPMMVMSWLWVVVLAAWSVLAAMTTNAYMEMFASAGVDLPHPAILFIHGRYLWGLLLIPALLLAWHASRQQYTQRIQRRLRLALAGLLIVSTGLAILWFAAMDSVIFCLTTVIE